MLQKFLRQVTQSKFRKLSNLIKKICIFLSGDLVTLNGNTGILKLI